MAGDLDSVTVRPAIPADAAGIVAVEVRAPVIAGDTKMTIDRGDDYFAAARLMEWSDIVVAEDESGIVAVHCAAFPLTSIGGVEQRVNYIHHLRIAPEYQRRRLLGRIKEVAVPRYPEDSTTSYAYVDQTNPLSQSMRQNPNYGLWSLTPMSLEVDTATFAGRAVGRAATPADAGLIVETLNTFHKNTEFWRPLTEDLLADRLSRSPDLYTWSDLRIEGDAVLGVWRAGRTITVISESPTERLEARQGVVLDHGCLPGAERALKGLLRAAAADLADEKLNRLVLFTYDGSGVQAMLRNDTTRTRCFDLWTTKLAQPKGARSVHVDPIYF